MRQIILDTETTGLRCEEGHRIIEIGCVELLNRKFTGRTYHQYLNPQRVVDKEALAVHGLTDTFLATQPFFSAIAKEFVEFIRGAELIIHNAPFDVGFINAELTRLEQGWQPITEYCQIVDTLLLARQLHTGQRNGLDALCKRYHVDNSQRELHGALLDARLLAEVYLAMTGGQGNLFDGLQKQPIAKIETQVQSKKIISQQDVLVIKANSDELLAHNNLLKTIAEKNDCLWLMGDGEVN